MLHNKSADLDVKIYETDEFGKHESAGRLRNK